MRRPRVFVSSTCYDLKQVRNDLKIFLEGHGLEAVLSEFDSFPVDPNASNLDNCLRAVEAKADIFVLIVGGRYGSDSSQGKSITNLEFLTAKAKGTPAYVFVLRSILDILPVWNANPSANFSGVVDSPKLFEFVVSLRDGGDTWVFPFDAAQDVCAALRTQFAYLFTDALVLRQRATIRNLSTELQQLRGPSLRLVIERPFAWEYLLFGQVLDDEIKKFGDLKRDWQYGIATGPGSSRTPRQAFALIQEKMPYVMRIARNIENIVNCALPDAFGPPGVSGDPENIVYAAKKFASLYSEVLEWKLDFSRIAVHDELRALLSVTSKLCDNVIPEIESFSVTYRDAVKEAIAAHVPGQPTVTDLKLVLTSPSLEEYNKELERVEALCQSGKLQWE